MTLSDLIAKARDIEAAMHKVKDGPPDLQDDLVARSVRGACQTEAMAIVRALARMGDDDALRAASALGYEDGRWPERANNRARVFDTDAEGDAYRAAWQRGHAERVAEAVPPGRPS